MWPNFSWKTCIIRTRTRHTWRRKKKKKNTPTLSSSPTHAWQTHPYRTSFVAASWGLGNRGKERESVEHGSAWVLSKAPTCWYVPLCLTTEGFRRFFSGINRTCDRKLEKTLFALNEKKPILVERNIFWVFQIKMRYNDSLLRSPLFLCMRFGFAFTDGTQSFVTARKIRNNLNLGLYTLNSLCFLPKPNGLIEKCKKGDKT